MTMEIVLADGAASAAGAEAEALVRRVPCAPGGRLHISWGAGHFLRVVDCVPSTSAAASACNGATATSLKWFRPSEAMRKVGYDAQPHFEKLQQRRQALLTSGRVTQAAGAEWSSEVATYCRTVSAVMGRNDDVREPPPQVTLEALETGQGLDEDPVMLWQRAVWELLEVFFVDKGSTRDIIAEDLGQWLRRNWSILGLAGDEHPGEGEGESPWAALREQASQGASSSRGLESQPLYWPAVHRAVALGWMGMAEDLLGWHSAWRRSQVSTAAAGAEPEVGALEAVQSLLRSIPHFCREGSVDITGRAFHNLPEFLRYRQRWVLQCQQFLYMDEFAETWESCRAASAETASGLRALLQVLAGEEAALRSSTRSWLELLVATVLHASPALRPQPELPPLLRRCVELREEEQGQGGAPCCVSEPWGGALMLLLEAAADSDAQSVVAALQGGPGLSPWFLCHVSDMLGASGGQARALLRALMPFHGCDQVEHYALDYAMSLAPYPASWQLAARYLSWCPSHGLPALRLLLERLPFNVPGGDAPLARKALSICRHHGEQLSSVAAGICRTMGAAAAREGRFGAALGWLLRANDARRAGEAVGALVRAVEAAIEDGTSEVVEVPGLAEVASLLSTADFSCSEGSVVPRPDGDGGKGGSMRAAAAALRAAPEGSGLLELLLRYHELRAAFEGLSEEPGAGTLRELTPGALPAFRGALLALLRPGVAPHRLWPALVFKAVPLMEKCPSTLFSLEDTQTLQRRLAESSLSGLSGACFAAQSEAGDGGSVSAMQVHVSRLALVRNAARMHIVEASSLTAGA